MIEPGLLSLVQDHGRRSSAGLGVPRAGPADPEAMRLANRLVGNPDGTAAIEITASGPTLRVTQPTYLTVVAGAPGAVEVRVDDLSVPAGTVVPVGAGQVVTVGRVRNGLRAYLAVSGGFDTPLEVDSRSSDVLCGLGPGPLRAGDRLDVGPPSRPHGQLVETPTARTAPADQRHRVVRVVVGPHPLAPESHRRLLTSRWVVADTSNRVGIRLVPDTEPVGTGGHRTGGDEQPDRAGTTTPPAGIPSTGMVVGAVQVPPDGNPIILMPDHATVGGYPVGCCVITADFRLLGQLGPGDTLSFTAVDRSAAVRARADWEHSLDGRVSGWFPTAAGT